jgi:hypothetical protein
MLIDHPQNIHQLLTWEQMAIQLFNKLKNYFKTLKLNKTTNCRKQSRVHRQNNHSGLFPKMNQNNVAIKFCIKY